MIGREHADPIRGADQNGGDRVLIGGKQPPARPLSDQAVLVVDEEGLAAALASQPAQEGQLRAEDERIVEVEDVEALDAGQGWDEGRIADRKQGLDPVHPGPSGVGRLALGRGGEHLNVVPALGLALGEAIAGIPGAPRVRREGRRQMGDPQVRALRRAD